jgi:hypothetical protein
MILAPQHCTNHECPCQLPELCSGSRSGPVDRLQPQHNCCTDCAVYGTILDVCICQEQSTHLRWNSRQCSVSLPKKCSLASYVRKLPRENGRRGPIATRCSSPNVRTADEICCHSHQLGLHQAAKSLYLSEKEKVLSQRLYITTRTFDAYITSSLGLPPNFHAVDAPGHFTEAPYISDKRMLAVASANVELLEIMSNTRERMFFTDAVARKGGSAIIALDQLEELSKTLDQWASRYDVSRQASDAGIPDRTKSVKS